MSKSTLPQTSQYCEVCLNKDLCNKSKTCSCENFKTNIKFRN